MFSKTPVTASACLENRQCWKGLPMLPYWLPAVATAALAASMLLAMAQQGPPPASAPASAPLATKPGPRLLTPTELRDSASTPGDLRPEERVTPQIVIPLRKTAPPAKTQRAAARQGTAASSAAIDDSVARCEAQSSEPAREKCRAGLAEKGRLR